MSKLALRAMTAVILLSLALGGAARADGEKVFPTPGEMAGAVMSRTEQMDDGTISVVYTGATDDSLAYLTRLLNFYGYGVSESIEDDGVETHLAFDIGTGALLVITYDAGAGELTLFTTDTETAQAGDEEIQSVIDYYTQDIVLPSGADGCVFPQFYASVGLTSASYTYYTDSSEFFPGTEECWVEEYDGLEAEKVGRYLSDMVLCGFDVGFVYYTDDDDNMTMIFPLSSGDAELILMYDLNGMEATLLYEPGVAYYLLSGVEYTDTIPSR